MNAVCRKKKKKELMGTLGGETLYVQKNQTVLFQTDWRN